MTRERIKGFDGLRALAVVAVFLGHRAPGTFAGAGSFGVWLFFALSGYLVVGILNRSRMVIESGGSARAELTAFLTRRTLRIFPVYYLTLSLMGLLALGGFTRDWSSEGFIFHLLYLSNVWIGSLGDHWAGSYSHLWSLSVEEQFYLLAAPLLILTPARLHARLCLIVAVAGLMLHLGMRLAGPSAVEVYTNSLVNFGYIALGGALATLRPRHPARTELYLLGAIAAYAALWYSARGGSEAVVALAAPFLGAAIVWLVVGSQDGPVTRALEWVPIVGLGKISYGFYLVHNLLYVEPFARSAMGSAGNLLANFALSLLVAALSWVLIERPLLRLGQGRLVVAK